MSNQTVKSAERTLVLFEYFALEQRPLTIMEIATAMQMPQSSTSALVKSLVVMGYLSHDNQKRTYYPTLRIALLGTWMRRRHQKAELLPRLLSRVAEETGETALIAMRNGIYVQYLAVQQGRDRLRLHVDSGMMFPLACTAPGWALLATETDEEVGRIIRRIQAEVPEAMWRERAPRAIDGVTEMRRDGYVISRGRAMDHVSAVAILLSSSGDTRLAACVGGPISRISEKEETVLESLRRMADEVTPDAIARMVTANAPVSLEEVEQGAAPEIE